MGSAWEFATDDPSTVKHWGEVAIRNTEKSNALSYMAYNRTKGDNAMRLDSANKMPNGIIANNSDLKGDAPGDAITITNLTNPSGRAVRGNQLLRGNGDGQDTYTMSVTIDDVAKQIQSKGRLSEKRTRINFAQAARDGIATYFGQLLEEFFVAGLWQLPSWNVQTGPKLKTLGDESATVTQSEADLYNNPWVTWDAAHIRYAGDATSDATVDSGDVLSARFLSKLQTYVQEGLDIPFQHLNIDGEECLILLTGGTGIEQLTYDEEWRSAQGTYLPKRDNPILKRAIGKYGCIYVVEYNRCLHSSANVMQSMLLGADAFQHAPVKELEFSSDYIDDAKRRIAVNGTMMFGGQATNFNGERKNALAVRSYSRSVRE